MAASHWLLSALLMSPPLAGAAQALPSLASLIQQVQKNQRELDKTREAYTFRELQVMHELDKHGAVKKQETREYNVFYVNGHPIQRLVRKDGKALNAEQEAKETAHIQQKIADSEKTPPGDVLNNRHQVSIARMLSIQHFSNERRVIMDNRPMIAIDFAGDPKAQTHGIAEDATKHLSGTVWVDEQDHQVRRVQATLDSPMHLELGLVSLSAGSSFSFDQKIINNEVWLPTSATVHIEAKAALFLGYHIQVDITDDQYKRFQASANQGDGAPVDGKAPAKAQP